MPSRPKRAWANRVLFAAAAGWIVVAFFGGESWPVRLLLSGLSAALVGGITDLYAVTALFRRIRVGSFTAPKSDVLRRNRARVEKALQQLIEGILLSPAALAARLGEARPSEAIERVLCDDALRRRLVGVLTEIERAVVQHIEPDRMAPGAASLLKSGAVKFRLLDAVRELFDRIDRSGDLARLFDFIVREIVAVARSERFTETVAGVIAAVEKAYGADAGKKRLFAAIATLARGGRNRLAKDVQEALAGRFEKMLDRGDPWRKSALDRARDWRRRLDEDSDFARQFESSWAESAGRFDWHALMKEVLYFTRRELLDPDGTALADLADRITIEARDLFLLHIENEDRREAFDASARARILAFVDRFHGKIGLAVRTRLAAFDDDQLVQTVKTRVGDDLEVIRISGTVIGFFVGMLMHVVFFLIGLGAGS